MHSNQKIKDFETPTPIDEEREFRYDELFFSVTDPKSVITFANDTFIKISAYKEEELLGVLHKIIRHPDIPRAVFKIFWDLLLNNKPVAAYVKNMAKDGRYYWVMALAFPCKGGYLSIRLKPGSALFNTAKELYKQTLQFEKEQEQIMDKKTAMHKAEDFLLQELKSLGFDDYEQFMLHALEIEMQNRENIIHSANYDHKPTHRAIPAHMIKLDENLSKLFNHLGELKKLQENLISNSEFISNLASTISLLSLNAQISSSKLTQEDISISVVAQNMGIQANEGRKFLSKLKKNVQVLSQVLSKLNFDVIGAKLMVEMTNFYHNEIQHSEKEKHLSPFSPEEIIKLLNSSFTPYLIDTQDKLEKLTTHIYKLNHDVSQIEKLLKVLNFIHNTGKIEISRIRENEQAFINTFHDLKIEINAAQKKVNVLSDYTQGSIAHNAFYKKSLNELQQLSNSHLLEMAEA